MIITSKLTIFGIIAITAVLLTPLANDNSVIATPPVTITVNGLDLAGGIHHMYTTLQNPSGTVVASGYTPVSLSATSGQQYIVHVSNYQTTVFNHWDDGTTNPSRSITPTQNVALTAYFSTGSTTTVPGAPTGLGATAVSSSQINLSWTAPSSNGGSAITGYKIESSTNGGTTWSTIVTNTASTSTTYSNTGLTSGTTYTYRVSAINSVGTGSTSNTASATATASTQVTITVNALDLSGGIHHMSTELENPSGTIIATGFTPVSFSVTQGQQYIVFVNNYQTTVFNHWDDGTTNPSRSITPTQNVALTAYYSITTVPGAPTGLGATAGNAQVSLSWTAPTNNGGSAITGYDVYRGTTSGGESSTPIATGITSTSYVDTGLANSQTYYYTVSAVNSVGTGSSSNESSATPMGDSTVPDAPTNLAATAVSSSQINLSWTAPANIGGSPIIGYKIERSTDGGSTWSTIVSNTGNTATTYGDTGLTSGTTYTYRVSAINSVGTGSPSNTASDTIIASTQLTINKIQSGLVTFDPLNNVTQTQQQLQANQQYWKYFGDAPARNAPYDYFKDNQGLHVGVAAPSNGTWAGFYAEGPDTSATLFHSVITTPVSTLPSQHNWYENGMYVQTYNGSINYITCFSITSTLGTQWILGSTTGNNHQATSFYTYWTDTSPNQPLTRDCTIITNGNNYLKAYIDGVLVYSNSTLNLQMPPPFNVYLEPQSSYAGQILNGVYKDYYAADENIRVINLPSNAATVSVTDSFGTTLSSASVSNGNATINVGQYHFPLAGIIKAYDTNHKLVESTPSIQNIYGGDLYSSQ